jgi:phosphinothricin acetyltransferase
MSQDINIRPAEFSDLADILVIFNQAVRARINGSLQEETVESRSKWFNNFNQNDYPIYVAEQNNRVVGYCYLSPYRSGRQAMNKVAEISYYINYNYHRQGIASALIEFTINDCQRVNKNNLLAILLDKNKSSISILKKFGFKEWGYFPDIVDLDGEICSQLIYGLKLG